MRDVIWRAQPDAVITRDVIDTPEQTIPGVPLDRAWESCLTMGTAWQYKPTHENYRSGTELIEILIETRAKGGNLLLNVGPQARRRAAHRAGGAAARDRAVELRLRRVDHRRAPLGGDQRGQPLVHPRRRARTRVYVFITKTPWVMGERKTFRVRSVRPTKPDPADACWAPTARSWSTGPTWTPARAGAQDGNGAGRWTS